MACSPVLTPAARPKRSRYSGRDRDDQPRFAHRLEDIIDTSGAAPRIEALLPTGVRHRQLRARTLQLGMMLTLADRRPAYLTEVHAALTAHQESEDQLRPRARQLKCQT